MSFETMAAGQGGEKMRLFRRTLVNVLAAPRAVEQDGMGGVREGFSDERIPLEASVSYVANTLSASGNNLNQGMYGVSLSQSIRLRMAPGAQIRVGDGAMMPGEDRIMWRCVQVDEYPHVKIARMERIAGDGA